MNLDIFSVVFPITVMTLNIFVLRTYLRIFELCPYSILFLSTSGASSVKTSRTYLPLSNKLVSVTVLYSNNGFFIFFIFGHNCTFYEYILLPCRIIAFLTCTVK